MNTEINLIRLSEAPYLNDRFINFLYNLKSQPFIFVPTPGKAGDALLAHVTYQIFDELGLDYKISSCEEKFKNEVILFGGGGNLVGSLYHEAEDFINNNFENNQMILLPHTIYNLPSLKKWLTNSNFKIFSRELITFKYLLDNCFFPDNIFLVEDIAFYIRPEEFLIYKQVPLSREVCNSIREDEELLKNLLIPNNNFDVAKTWDGDFWHNKFLCKHVVHSIASYLAPYKLIRTNRLHTAILAGIMQKDVVLLPSAYHKNKSVFSHSIINRLPNVKFEFG